MCASKALIDVLSLAMLRAALALTDWQRLFAILLEVGAFPFFRSP